MNRLLSSLGLSFILLSMPAGSMAQSSASSSSAPDTLYTRIKEEVKKETSQGVFDDEVVKFLELTYKDSWNLNEQQIKDVLQGQSAKACAAADEKSPLRNRVPCSTMATSVLNTAIREQSVRSLGRNLTTLIAGYELPLSDLPERTLHLSSDLLGILNIWSAGTGSILSSKNFPTIITMEIDDSIKPELEDVGAALKNLPPEERIAAVWRLRAGVRLTLDERGPTYPSPTLPGPSTDGTERQYLDKNWDDLNRALTDLFDAIRNIPLTRPLGPGETAYVVFPKDLIKKTIPDNILVWVRLDGDTQNLYADVGLDWGIPLEPVFPSLKKDGEDEAIPGGNFPPEPVFEKDGRTEPWNGMQLCSNPLAQRGYLCRPFEVTKPGERCPVETTPNDDTISLVHCTVTGDGTTSQLQWCATGQNEDVCKPLDPNACQKVNGVACGTLDDCQKTWGCRPDPTPSKPIYCCLKKSGNICAVATSSTECVQRGGSPSADEAACVANGCDAPIAPDIRFTAAGADVCRETGWKNREPFDPQTQCKLTLRCAQTCDPRQGVEGFTKVKEASGNIDLCIQENTSGAATYLLYHELVHAYQFCGEAPGTDYEGTPPNASEQEKNDIRSRNTERCCRIEGEAFRIQCAMMERDGLFKNAAPVDGIPMNAQTCAEYATDSACGPRDNFNGCFTSYEYTPGFIQSLSALTRANPKDLPATCTDAMNPAKMDPRVKALKDLVEKRDDVCKPATTTEYINRIGNNLCYIGQCAEQSIELHRITAGQSPAVAEGAVAPWQEPVTGTPLGNLLSNPPLSQYRFPPYRPQLLVNALDAALCASAGLPPLMPPALCAVEATRQLNLTRTVGFETALGIIGQNNEQQIELRDLLKLSRGLGVRAGTEMYGDYLRESSRSFSEIIGMAATLLEQLNSITFPTEMCPISPGLPPSQLSSSSAS